MQYLLRELTTYKQRSRILGETERRVRVSRWLVYYCQKYMDNLFKFKFIIFNGLITSVQIDDVY